MSGEMKTKPDASRVLRISKPRRPATGAGRASRRSIAASGGRPERRAAGKAIADDAGRAFDVDHDAGTGVLDPARELQPAGEAVDEGAEADALDDAEHGQPRRRPAGDAGLRRRDRPPRHRDVLFSAASRL